MSLNDYEITRPGNDEYFCLHVSFPLPKMPFFALGKDNDPQGIKLKEALLQVEGVEDVFNTRYRISVQFGRMFEIEEIAKDIMRVLNKVLVREAN